VLTAVMDRGWQRRAEDWHL